MEFDTYLFTDTFFSALKKLSFPACAINVMPMNIVDFWSMQLKAVTITLILSNKLDWVLWIYEENLPLCRIC